MNRRKRMMIVVCGLLCMFICGCTQMQKPQADGTVQTVTVVDPNFVDALEALVEGAGQTATGMTPIAGPISGIIGGALLTALGLWRKVKPRIMDAENKAELSHAVSASLVEAIEMFKKDNPGEWAKLEPKIDKALKTAGLDPKVIENVIRGLRGLPPKG